ncbi:hypothetical protein BGW80DRAFT_1261280, partial [Lactifluus volemus]
MKATSNSETELAMGREPTEMLQPTTTTRAVHGVSRCWSTHSYVGQDRSGAWLSNSWHPRLHFHVNVSYLIGCSQLLCSDKAGRSRVAA